MCKSGGRSPDGTGRNNACGGSDLAFTEDELDCTEKAVLVDVISDGRFRLGFASGHVALTRER
jgi:hypothetical protein